MKKNNIKKISVNGLTIGYQEMGEGEVLLLLHGGVSDSRYWQDQLEAFSDEYRVIAWDAPGCGVSDDPPEGFGLGDYADTLAGFCQQLEINHPHVLGISFGGGLAISFAHRHPQIPKSLILVSAYAGWAGSLPPEEVDRRLEKGRSQVEMDPEEVAEMWLPSLFYSEPKEDVKAREIAIISDFHPTGSQIMLEAFAEADLQPALPEIHTPTLLLYGEEDQRSPIHVAKDLHKKIPGSKLVTLPEVGHVINLEAPEQFDVHVRAFLRNQYD